MLATPLTAAAQTWAGNRQRPSLRDIVTVDRTGEVAWVWGREDVAGDGLSRFTDAEQAIDARSVYLRSDAGRLWWRTYVSAATRPGSGFTAYLFVDADLDATTGRTAAAPEIDAAFVEDPSGGGYEYVVGVRGDGQQAQLWGLDALGTAFARVATPAADLDGEANAALDPLRVGQNEHGYVQASLLETLVGITAQCQARFYIRATNQTQGLGDGDLDVGESVRCVATDTNQNQVPDPIEPDAECLTDAECPSRGLCWNRRCWIAPVCNDDADCAATDRCENGSCVVRDEGTCRTSGECSSQLCVRGQCVSCTSDDACGAGRVCGPDGRCVDRSAAGVGGASNSSNNQAGTGAIVLAEGERIQGGACACRVGRHAESPFAYWVGLGVAVTLASRRRRAGKASRGSAQ
jgi:hypothetical protein